MLRGAVDGPHEDEAHADVQRVEHGLDAVGGHAGADAAGVEEDGEGVEEGDDAELEGERGAHEVVAEGVVFVGRGADREVGDAEGVEDLDRGGEGSEGGEHAAGVDWREVRDVVEGAAEDVVVC